MVDLNQYNEEAELGGLFKMTDKLPNCRFNEEVSCNCPEKEMSDDYCFLCLICSVTQGFYNLFHHFEFAKIPLREAVLAFGDFRLINACLDCFVRFRETQIMKSPLLQKVCESRLKLYLTGKNFDLCKREEK
jgi:hypothetical protein